MSNKLFVGGLAWRTDESTLMNAFAEYGEVVDCKIITHQEGEHAGKSRGFGFVTFASEQDAREAMSQLNGADLDGRELRVDLAQQQQRRGNGHNRDNNRRGNRRHR